MPRGKKVSFLDAAKGLLKTKEIPIPELDMTLVANGLSAGVMQELNEKATGEDGELDANLLGQMVISASLTDEDGERVVEPGREAELFELPASILKRIQEAVTEVCGMETVEDAEKN